MKKSKKVIALMLCIIVTLSVVVVPASAASKVTMYAPDGRTVSVSTDSVKTWESVGWYKKPVVTMYAPDGRKQVVYKTDVAAWEKVGWSTDSAKKVTIYAPDGRTAKIPESQLKDYLKVGWLCKHQWKEATCSSPKKCTVCGETKGSAGAHYYHRDTGKCDCGKKYKIYDDRGIKIYFRGISYGYTGLDINLEIVNNSGKEELIQIWDGYVHGNEANYVMSVLVKPGETIKTDTTIWYSDLEELGFSDLDKINKFDFAFRFCRSNFYETPMIKLRF